MYDGDRLLCELDDDGAVTSTLSWGAAGLFAYGDTQYQFDLQGTVVARTSAGDQVLSTHWYDAHGTEQTTPSAEPYAYKGQWGYHTDRETGLILCTHRYLDPEAGRWLTRDPISYAGGVNLHAYCANRPVAAADPSGQFIFVIFAVLAVLDTAFTLYSIADGAGSAWGYFESGYPAQGWASLAGVGADALSLLEPGVPGVAGLADDAVDAAGDAIKHIDDLHTPKPTEASHAAAGPGTIYEVPGSGTWDPGFNPFKGKTPQEIDAMLTGKGFTPVGEDPINGRGAYIAPVSGRPYRLDPFHGPPYGPHVDVGRRPRSTPPGRWRDFRRIPM